MFIEKVGEERFYPIGDRWVPSVTTILGAVYPKSPFLIDWKMQNGKEESKRIMEEAAEEGTLVHETIERLIQGETIKAEELSSKGRKCIQAFLAWYRKFNPKIISNELRVDYDVRGDYAYAGTIDLVVEIDGELWIVDVKTSANVWPEHHVQVTAYSKGWNSEPKNQQIRRGAILHLNSKTKQGFSWNEVDFEKNTDIWNACVNMFYALNPDPQPKFIEYPEYFTLAEEEVK